MPETIAAEALVPLMAAQVPLIAGAAVPASKVVRMASAPLPSPPGAESAMAAPVFA
jgi:hypothetical protein